MKKSASTCAASLCHARLDGSGKLMADDGDGDLAGRLMREKHRVQADATHGPGTKTGIAEVLAHRTLMPCFFNRGLKSPNRSQGYFLA